MSEVKKIIVYMRDEGTYKIKKDFALFYFEDTPEGRAFSAVSDFTGEDNLQLIELLSQLITNSVLSDIEPVRKGAAYMQVINTFRSCSKKIWEEHQDDIAAFIRTEVTEAIKPRIILPGEGQLQ